MRALKCTIIVSIVILLYFSVSLIYKYLLYFLLMISYRSINCSKMFSVLQSSGFPLQSLSFFLFVDIIVESVELKYFVESVEFSRLWILGTFNWVFVKQFVFFHYYWNLINWCFVIFSFNFSYFLCYHFDALTHFIKYGYLPFEFLHFVFHFLISICVA